MSEKNNSLIELLENEMRCDLKKIGSPAHVLVFGEPQQE